jgi:hypothetical protein
MEGTNAFESEVIAYPSITVIERATGTTTRTARRPEVTHASMGKLVRAMLNGGPKSDPRVEEVEGAVTSSDPWLLDEADQLRVLRDGGSCRSVGSSPHISPSWSLSALQRGSSAERVVQGQDHRPHGNQVTNDSTPVGVQVATSRPWNTIGRPHMFGVVVTRVDAIP